MLVDGVSSAKPPFRSCCTVFVRAASHRVAEAPNLNENLERSHLTDSQGCYQPLHFTEDVDLREIGAPG